VGTTTTTPSKETVNGRPVGDVGTKTTKPSTDKPFTRDTTVTPQSVSTTVTQKYDKDVTISRTTEQRGRRSSETIEYNDPNKGTNTRITEAQRGDVRRSTTVTTDTPATGPRTITRDDSVTNGRRTDSVRSTQIDNGSQSFLDTTKSSSVTDGRVTTESYTRRTQGTRTTTTGPEQSRVHYEGGQYRNAGPYGNNNYSGGKFVSTRGVDRQTTDAVEVGKSTTIDTRADERGTALDEQQRADDRAARAANRDRQQQVLDVAADLGLQTTVHKAGSDKETVTGTQATTTTSADGKTTTETLVGQQSGTKAYNEVTVGVNGVASRGDASARTGLYAEQQGTRKTESGELKGRATAKAELAAQANYNASLGVNGLNATAHAKAGAEVSAEVAGSYRTNPKKIGDVELTAGVEARAKVAAEATAEATGTVKFTGDPPAAVVSGEAGASAVVKAEAEAKIDAGPFSVRGQAYASAGAEAKIGGHLGYDDGKLSVGFNAGAALGLGVGGRVQVQVDVAQVGKIAQEGVKAASDKIHSATDLTGDGRFGMDDVGVIKDATVDAVSDAAEAVADGVSDAAHAVADGVSNAASAVADGVSDAADAVANRVNNGARAVKDFFTGWW
jgi:hypothetical protein